MYLSTVYVVKILSSLFRRLLFADTFVAYEATIRVIMERYGESCVQRAAAGDSAAFGLLVEEHTPWLLVRLTRRLGSQEAAEDVLQEAFIAAYQQLAELRDSRAVRRLAVLDCG